MRRSILLLCLACAGAVLADAGAVILEEPLDGPGRGWLVDQYSRFEDGRYVIDARGQGGYYRWLQEPDNLTDFLLSVEVEKARGNNTEPLYGVLLRVQEGWENSYFVGINGAATYYFGKFVGGQAVLLKQGQSAALQQGGGQNTLAVRAQGHTFMVELNGEPVANVADDTFAGPGRVGLFVEAPAMVRFDNLRVTSLAAAQPGPTVGPEPGPTTPPVRTLYSDDFDRATGWAEDEFRVLEGGEYRLRNQGEQKSFLSWQPATKELTDFAASIDARQYVGSAGQLYGLCWRVLDGENFYFFLVNPDGTWYAGLRTGEAIKILAKGRGHRSVRPGNQSNTLSVRAEGSLFRVGINGTDAASFTDATLRSGSIGVYLEQAGDVGFDDLVITDLGDTTPPLVGPTAPRELPWPVGAQRYHEPLDQNIGQHAWLTDERHEFAQGGYCFAGPEQGSETLLALPTGDFTDGVVTVNARAMAGPVQAGFGLVLRADPTASRFYYLLVNSAGRYFVGRCIDGQFATADTGPVAELRGGDAGNDLQVRAEGKTLRFAVNGREVSRIEDAQLTGGAVGLHVEHGVTACFRHLRVFAPAE